MRQRLEQHMENASCASCHMHMDPPGLALEHFDALGKYRETDEGLTIDATGEIDGEPFDGATELGSEFALGTQVHPGAPIPDIVEAFDGTGRQFPELVRALVSNEVFRLVSAPR